MTFDIPELDPRKMQDLLYHIVGPRPICLASTIDRKGDVNLSPFSFYNLFSFDPPVLVFSPLRRYRDMGLKDTLENILEVPEVVINMVDHAMVQQVSLASGDYPKGIDEFLKAGFTRETPRKVLPPMVRESRAKMECKVTEVKPLGMNGGAGNLVICEVLVIHIDASLYSADGRLQQEKFGLVARMGADWYCGTGEHLFQVARPGRPGIGFDRLPATVRYSTVLTGHELALLAGVPELPLPDQDLLNRAVGECLADGCFPAKNDPDLLHRSVQRLLKKGKPELAWQLLL